MLTSRISYECEIGILGRRSMMIPCPFVEAIRGFITIVIGDQNESGFRAASSSSFLPQKLGRQTEWEHPGVMPSVASGRPSRRH